MVLLKYVILVGNNEKGLQKQPLAIKRECCNCMEKDVSYVYVALMNTQLTSV